MGYVYSFAERAVVLLRPAVSSEIAIALDHIQKIGSSAKEVRDGASDICEKLRQGAHTSVID